MPHKLIKSCQWEPWVLSSDWGLMVSEGRVYLGQAPLISVTPALAIAVLTIGINLVSDQIGVFLARNGSGHARL